MTVLKYRIYVPLTVQVQLQFATTTFLVYFEKKLSCSSLMQFEYGGPSLIERCCCSKST